MALLLRRNKFGLSTLRNLNREMSNRTIIRNSSTRLPTGRGDEMCFLWGYVDCDLPRGYTYLNKPSAVGISSNKAKFRKILSDNNIAPKTTLNYADAVLMIESGKTLIVRPSHHYGGINLHKCDSVRALDTAIRKTGNGWYASEYINKIKEFRVFVVGGRIAWILNKIPDSYDSIAWNTHQGGRFENLRFGEWNKDVVLKSIKAMSLAGLDYGAVDVILDNNNTAYILEINSSPKLDSPYWVTGVAKCFDYIINTKKIFIPIQENDRFNWRNYIHPAMSEEAIKSQKT